MMSFCNQCGNYHESVTVCGHSVRTPAPLPPTAEQTSIARFNALADQVRAVLLELGAARDRHEQISIKLEKIHQSLGYDFDALHKKIERAVAKKKAAPLVGKKGTGRKG